MQVQLIAGRVEVNAEYLKGMNANEAAALAKLINELQNLLPAGHSAAEADDDSHAVRRFLRERLCRHPAGAIRSADLWAAFTDKIMEGQFPPISKNRFLRLLPAAMQAEFGIGKSHSIKQDDGVARGFHGVFFRSVL